MWIPKMNSSHISSLAKLIKKYYFSVFFFSASFKKKMMIFLLMMMLFQLPKFPRDGKENFNLWLFFSNKPQIHKMWELRYQNAMHLKSALWNESKQFHVPLDIISFNSLYIFLRKRKTKKTLKNHNLLHPFILFLEKLLSLFLP
jgi:hypothetical protein